MTRTLASIGSVWQAVQAADNPDTAANVGFCLDTCHAHAAGLDLATAADDIRAITGRIDLVHLNDSRDPHGSGMDRHANLGAGQVDHDKLVALLRSADAPAVLETPGGLEGHRADLTWVRDRLS
jgi:deoxyribonuclease-4